MPNTHALGITVTEHLFSFIRMGVASGRHSSTNEVIRAELRLLEERTLRRSTLSAKEVSPSKRLAPADGKARRVVEKA